MKFIIIITLMCGCYHYPPVNNTVVIPPPTYMEQPLPYLLDKTSPPQPIHPHHPNVVWVWVPAHTVNGRVIMGHWEQRRKPKTTPVVRHPKPPIKRKPPPKPKPKKK